MEKEEHSRGRAIKRVRLITEPAHRKSIVRANDMLVKYAIIPITLLLKHYNHSVRINPDHYNKHQENTSLCKESLKSCVRSAVMKLKNFFKKDFLSKQILENDRTEQNAVV